MPHTKRKAAAAKIGSSDDRISDSKGSKIAGKKAPKLSSASSTTDVDVTKDDEDDDVDDDGDDSEGFVEGGEEDDIQLEGHEDDQDMEQLKKNPKR